MMKRAAAMLSVVLFAGHAHAWEAETTHAGFAEQAALSSRLRGGRPRSRCLRFRPARPPSCHSMRPPPAAPRAARSAD